MEEARDLNTDSIETDNTNTNRKSFKKSFREKSWFGKKCVKIFRVFSNAFAMTFLAEWGDRYVEYGFRVLLYAVNVCSITKHYNFVQYL